MAWETLIELTDGTEVLIPRITPTGDAGPALFAPLSDSASTSVETSGVEVSK